MKSKLPILAGDELIRILERFGYARVRQKGSHVRLRHSTEPQRKPLTVPLHKALKRGLVHRLLRDARITDDELVKQL